MRSKVAAENVDAMTKSSMAETTGTTLEEAFEAGLLATTVPLGLAFERAGRRCVLTIRDLFQ